MLRASIKRFVNRFVIRGVCLFIGIHYTWMCYYSFISTIAPKKSREGVFVILERSSYVKPLTNWSAIGSENYPNTNTESATVRQTTKASSDFSFPRCESPVFTVITVISAPKNFDRRSVIRNTWARVRYVDSQATHIMRSGSYTPETLIKTVFLLGKTDEMTQSYLETESALYKDIVLGSFTDSYANLTMKAQLGLEWAHKFCKFDYYLKTDDDVFVYSNGLVKLLWNLPREKVYTGRCDFNKTVIRQVGHKW